MWFKGEADVDSYEHSPTILEPAHFQCLFLIMGCFHSFGLIVLLLDILANPHFEFLKLMLSGLSACLLITFVNLFFFSTVFLIPITRETEERREKKVAYNIASSAKTISTGDYEIDLEILKNNKSVAFAILGYGAIVSIIFIFIAMMKSLGKSFSLDPSYHILTYFNSGVTYYNFTKETTAHKEGNVLAALENSIIIYYTSYFQLQPTWICSQPVIEFTLFEYIGPNNR